MADNAKRTFDELPVIEQNLEGKIVEAIGMYRGHLWAVTFAMVTGHRCGYVSFDKDTDNQPEEVFDEEVTFWGKGDHIIKNGFLGLPLVGWDYMHLRHIQDFKAARRYAYTSGDRFTPELKKEFNQMWKMNKEMQKIMKPTERHSLSSVIKDCRKNIDRLIDGRPDEEDEINELNESSN